MNKIDIVYTLLHNNYILEGIKWYDKQKIYNKETLNAIKEADKIMKNPEKYKSYNDIYEMIEEIEDESNKIWN